MRTQAPRRPHRFASPSKWPFPFSFLALVFLLCPSLRAYGQVSTPRDKALTFIIDNQNADGGWGYWPGGASATEPTAFCLLVLDAAGRTERMGDGLEFLKKIQLPSGGIGFGPADREGGWMAYSALLAFHALGAQAEEKLLKEWMLRVEDASSRFSSEDRKIIAELFRYDASLKAWPWTPGTNAWVEPTSLFITSLVQTGTPPDEERIQSAVEMLLDRNIASGGWNYGSSFDGFEEAKPSGISTALALLALGAAGYSDRHPAVREALGFIDRRLQDEMSPAALAWIILAKKTISPEAENISLIVRRLAGHQLPDGSFRGNLFETALALLALGDAGILLRQERSPSR